MNKMIKAVHPKTWEILLHAREQKEMGLLTVSEYNEIVLECFKAEAAREILGKYPETIEV